MKHLKIAAFYVLAIIATAALVTLSTVSLINGKGPDYTAKLDELQRRLDELKKPEPLPIAGNDEAWFIVRSITFQSNQGFEGSFLVDYYDIEEIEIEEYEANAEYQLNGYSMWAFPFADGSTVYQHWYLGGGNYIYRKATIRLNPGYIEIRFVQNGWIEISFRDHWYRMLKENIIRIDFAPDDCDFSKLDLSHTKSGGKFRL